MEVGGNIGDKWLVGVRGIGEEEVEKLGVLVALGEEL